MTTKQAARLAAQQTAIEDAIAKLQSKKKRTQAQLDALARQQRQARLAVLGQIVENAVGLGVDDGALEQVLRAWGDGRREEGDPTPPE